MLLSCSGNNKAASFRGTSKVPSKKRALSTAAQAEVAASLQAAGRRPPSPFHSFTQPNSVREGTPARRGMWEGALGGHASRLTRDTPLRPPRGNDSLHGSLARESATACPAAGCPEGPSLIMPGKQHQVGKQPCTPIGAGFLHGSVPGASPPPCSVIRTLA